jgi:hypothetical protein
MSVSVSPDYRCDRCGFIWPMAVGCWCAKCGVVPSAHPWPGDASTQQYFRDHGFPAQVNQS